MLLHRSILSVGCTVFVSLFASTSALAKVIYVAPACDNAKTQKPCGDDHASGETEDAPVATLAEGVKRAGAGGEVRVAVGRYDGLVSTGNGISILGGYSVDFRSRADLPADVLSSKDRDPNLYKTQTVLSNDQGDRVVVVDGSKNGGVLSDLVVLGPDRAVIKKDGAEIKDGGSSYGIVVQAGGTARLRRIKIIAGNGRAGKDGGDAARNQVQGCSKGGRGGQSAQRHILTEKNWIAYKHGTGHWEYIYAECESTAGSQGETVLDSQKRVLAAGGNGGAAGWGPCRNPNSSFDNADSGIVGFDGQAGYRGSAGVAAKGANDGFVSHDGELAWQGEDGGQGGSGSAGGGGGGGGAGGSRYDYWSWTTCETRIVLGGKGGDGGAGGCGGVGGLGAGQGGGSFGLVIWNTNITVEGLAILVGNGGKGGKGGAGGQGSGGRPGNPPTGNEADLRRDKCMAITSWSGEGMKGGTGGNGGPGGGGAGGSGGVVGGVAKIEKGKLTKGTGTFAITGGTGGTGGEANYGDTGRTGDVFQEKSFPLLKPKVGVAGRRR